MRPSSSRVWLLLPDASALIPPRQTHRLVGEHPESVVARTKAVEGRPDVQVHRHGLRSGGRGVVEVYHVPHLLSTPVYGPVVPVKGKLVAKPVQEPSPWAEVLRPPLELGQRRPAAHVLVELLPLKDVLPDSLVHRIVDGDHDVHVLLPRLPTLPLHRVVEHLRRGVRPVRRVLLLVVWQVSGPYGYGRNLPRARQRRSGSTFIMDLWHIVCRRRGAANPRALGRRGRRGAFLVPALAAQDVPRLNEELRGALPTPLALVAGHGSGGRSAIRRARGARGGDEIQI
mmetsp:Transcript_9802/g.33810  ORF Transcript_9802/g.33810 Transcript_9802/m.33810 type:complete len:285 (+) Transcript_9802:88-942(+)